MEMQINRIEQENSDPVKITLELTLDEACAITHLIGKSHPAFRKITGSVETKDIYYGLVEAVSSLNPNFNFRGGEEYQLRKV